MATATITVKGSVLQLRPEHAVPADIDALLKIASFVLTAPVLAQAHVSVAIGSGAPLAQTRADMVLMSARPRCRQARRRRGAPEHRLGRGLQPDRDSARSSGCDHAVDGGAGDDREFVSRRVQLAASDAAQEKIDAGAGATCSTHRRGCSLRRLNRDTQWKFFIFWCQCRSCWCC